MDFNERWIITGERLQSLADITIITPEVEQFHRSLSGVKTNLAFFDGHTQEVLREDQLPDPIRRAQIIFVYTHLLEDFFRTIFPALPHPVVLVTHNSDHCVTEKFRCQLDHPKLVEWYAQNALVKHPKLHSLPLGIANAQWVHGNTQELAEVMNEDIPKTEHTYVNFNESTNPQARAGLEERLRGKEFISIGEKKPFKDYLRDMTSHLFCIAPPGNGADCHRVWECLYLDVIPIVVADANNEQFADLPICRINDWDEVNEELFESEIARVNSAELCMDKLSLSYWRHRLEQSRQKAIGLM